MAPGMISLLVALLVTLSALLVAVFLSKRRQKIHNAAVQQAHAERKAAEAVFLTRIRGLASEVHRLEPYKGVADADARAAELLRNAEAESKRLVVTATAEKQRLLTCANSEKDRLLAAADADASRVRTEAEEETRESKQAARAAKAGAKEMLDQANLQAEQILQAAKKKAEETAGKAYEALNNSALYEKTARAMKNLVKGYGDTYLIPGHSLLDELADDFEHKDGGAELKRARARTKSMLEKGTAASCKYVETNRKETAIAFVIDAFNGKVDSILSRVRHDNAGTLQQEIRDAFTLVNYNGKAFRDAQISELYLQARFDELKWAAITQQLKLEEREEQRRLKAQMREEAKARKEFERAMREAAKEEDMLRKAMKKAEAQIAKANAEQRAKYEEQLAELSLRLGEAEARNQRALSMAQLTRRGHVYVISNMGSFGDDVFKIGLTRRLEPLDRVKELGDSSVPFEFDVHAMILSDDAPALETRLHKHFVLNQLNKVNHRKEFFRVALQEIREELEGLGIETKWTMLAEAREYRETQAIERAIQNDPSAREAWQKRQLTLDPGEWEAVQEAAG